MIVRKHKQIDNDVHCTSTTLCEHVHVSHIRPAHAIARDEHLTCPRQHTRYRTCMCKLTLQLVPVVHSPHNCDNVIRHVCGIVCALMWEEIMCVEPGDDRTCA